MLEREDWHPRVITQLPGPRSQEAALRLRATEGVGISPITKGAKPVFWKRALGVVVEDIDGNRFLDCTSSFGVASVGYCHPQVRAAIVAQCNSLIHTMPGIFPHLSYVDALEAIVNAVGRWDRSEVILTNTGSEAVEVALKLSLVNTGKPGVVAFQGAFHGQSLGALGVTSFNELRDPFAPILAHFGTWVPYPDPYRPPLGATPGSVADACLEYLRHTLRRDTVGGVPIGAVLVEPMQNSSGYVVPPEGFLRELRKLCTEHNVLLIADEIFTGFGRTGYWLAMDREEVAADIVCVGKSMTGGIPAAACLADHATMLPLAHPGIVPLHGSTFVANPVACAALAATIGVLRSEHLVERASSLGQTMIRQIRERCEQFRCVGDVRGLGAAFAVDFVENRASKKRDPSAAWAVMESLLSQGIITLVTGLPYGNVLAICPPLVITEEQCVYIVEALMRSIGSLGNSA